MDPEIVDSVTADSLEDGDLILVGESFVTVTNVEDATEAILVTTDSDDGNLIFEPNEKVDIYLYPAETIE